ncbi:MAG: chemotaxis protein CheX [Oscillospiraceae bacterium]
MIAQFFGNYLLNQRLVTTEQLKKAIIKSQGVRLKVGVLAINAGYMTAEQVDIVHQKQKTMDKKFGEIAVECGYLKTENIDELLSKQRIGHLLIAQTLVDDGDLTNSQFEAALNTYKLRYMLSDDEFDSPESEKINEIIKYFFHFGSNKFADLYSEYMSLLFKNLIRFIGDDFTPLSAQFIEKKKFNWYVSQNICGEFDAYTAIECDETAFVGLASRFAEEKYTVNDEYAKDAVSEFLNLNNGIFIVNMSNKHSLELDIAPNIVGYEKNYYFEECSFLVPIMFTFGVVNFIISGSIPLENQQ